MNKKGKVVAKKHKRAQVRAKAKIVANREAAKSSRAAKRTKKPA
jgi:hypothetical protein